MKKFHQFAIYLNAIYDAKKYYAVPEFTLKKLKAHHMDVLLSEEIS